MQSLVERLTLPDTAKRMKDGAHWPLICLFAALLESCGKLSLGSYGNGAGGRIVENDSAGAPGAGGPQSAGGYGNASGGVPQAAAGMQQGGGGLPALGGAGNGGRIQGGSPGTGVSGASNGGVSSAGEPSEGEAGQGGTGGEPSGGGASSGRPSCKGLPTRCGGSAEDCCTSIDVPGGPFSLGAGSTEAADARVSDFTLDKYEVTADRFRKFLSHYDEWRAGHNPAPGAGANPHVGGSGWQSVWDSQLAPSASEMEARIVRCDNLPFSALRLEQNFGPVAMNCVNWYEASAFCAWDGARLPTELEWEYAATGGDRAWPYPWGTDEPFALYANYNCPFSRRLDQYDPAQPPCILSVGQKPWGAGRWGHLDLAGSMAEWVFDTDRAYPSLCTDCANTSAGVTRGRRGGDWIEDAGWLGGAHRSSVDASVRSYFGGLRCAFGQSPAACATSCDPNADCNGAEGQVTCSCREGFVGDGHTCARPRSCAELHGAQPELGSGRYFLAPNASDPASEFLAWCEMSAEGGGWTLVLNQNETFDPTSLGNDYCFSSGCTNLAYSRVPLESDMLLDFDRDPIVGDQFSARALISGVQLAALGKTVRELFTTGPFFIDREDNSNVSVRVPSQVPCTEALPSDLARLLCETCPTGQPCTVPVLVFGDSDSDCKTEPLRFAIGGAFSDSDPWGNCAGWPQEPDDDYYTKNVRIWIR